VAQRWTAASRPSRRHARDAALCARTPGRRRSHRVAGGAGGAGERGKNGNNERDENGSTVRLRSRAFRVDAADDCGRTAGSIGGGWRDTRKSLMATYTLDFEKPLLELEKQIEELKRLLAQTRRSLEEQLGSCAPRSTAT